MHINANQKLLGYSAVEIRHMMRKCGFSCFSTGIAADALKIAQPKARKLVREVVKNGLLVDVSRNINDKLVRVYVNGESDRGNFYELTPEGHALRMATAR